MAARRERQDALAEAKKRSDEAVRKEKEKRSAEQTAKRNAEAEAQQLEAARLETEARAKRLLMLGQTFEMSEKREQAIDYYRQSLAILPNHPATEPARTAMRKFGQYIPEFTDDRIYIVSGVISGETIETRIDGKYREVGLLGVDVPDPAEHAKREGLEFSLQAMTRVKDLIEGKEVRLDFHAGDEANESDRLFAYVYRAGDGLDVNLELVRTGYAHAALDRPHSRRDEFRQSEAIAHSQYLGLWAPMPIDERKLPGPAPRQPGLRVTPSSVLPGGTYVRPARR